MSTKSTHVTAVDLQQGLEALELLKKIGVDDHQTDVALNLHTLRKKVQSLQEKRTALDELHCRRDLDGEMIPACNNTLDLARYAGRYKAERKYKLGALVWNEGIFYEALAENKGVTPAAGKEWLVIGRAVPGFYVRDKKKYDADVKLFEARPRKMIVRTIPLAAIEKQAGVKPEMYWAPMIDGFEIEDVDDDDDLPVEGDSLPEDVAVSVNEEE